MQILYDPVGPTRAQLDAMTGPAVVEFGTDWCGWCRSAQPSIAAAFATFPHIPHIRIEDGPGRPTGRSYRVKLWPTLIFLADGKEIERIVRPADQGAIGRVLGALSRSPTANQSGG